MVTRCDHRPNLHFAIEEILARPGAEAETLGVVADEEHASPDLGRLSREAFAGRFASGPVQCVDALAALTAGLTKTGDLA